MTAPIDPTRSLTGPAAPRPTPAAAPAPRAPGDTLALGASRKPGWSPDKFLVGGNLPWIAYGGDFGANAWSPRGGLAQPEARAKLDTKLDQLAAAGVQHLRWFALTDGRAGVTFAPDGTPTGLDPHVFADMDAALDALHQRGMKVTFALIDFKWLEPATRSGDVQMGGHADTIADPRKRRALVDKVFAPLFDRYGQHPAIEAWDLINEPEWHTRGETFAFWRGVPREAMRGFLRDATASAHRLATQPVTVGLASTSGLSLVKGLGLDFYQVHWYDHWYNRLPGMPKLGTDVAKFGLDGPLILGEFASAPGKSPHDTAGTLDVARKAGYAGGFAWSLADTDPYSDAAAAGAGIRRWSAANAERLAR